MFLFFLLLAPYARTTRHEEAFLPKGKNGLSVIYTTGGVYKRLYTPPVVYISAYIHYRRSFAAHTSGGPENS